MSGAPGRYAVQSAPANPQPRKTQKQRPPREAQPLPSRSRSMRTAPYRVWTSPQQPSAQPRRPSGLPPAGERRFNRE